MMSHKKERENIGYGKQLGMYLYEHLAISGNLSGNHAKHCYMATMPANFIMHLDCTF